MPKEIRAKHPKLSVTWLRGERHAPRRRLELLELPTLPLPRLLAELPVLEQAVHSFPPGKRGF